jgi:hypothetical protein
MRMRQKERPFGLWIVPAFDALAIGFIPLVGLLILYQNPDAEISVVTLTLTAALRLTVIAAAYGTWAGDNTCRLILLHSVTLASLLMIIDSGEWLQELVKTRDIEMIKLVGNIYRGIIWIVINWWYLNRHKTRDYFGVKPADA